MKDGHCIFQTRIATWMRTGGHVGSEREVVWVCVREGRVCHCDCVRETCEFSDQHKALVVSEKELTVAAFRIFQASSLIHGLIRHQSRIRLKNDGVLSCEIRPAIIRELELVGQRAHKSVTFCEVGVAAGVE